MEKGERGLEVKKEILLRVKSNLLALRDQWETRAPDKPVHSIPDLKSGSAKYKRRKSWFFLISAEIDDIIRFFWDKIDGGDKKILLEYKKKITDDEPGGFWDSHEKMTTKTGPREPRVNPDDIAEGDEIINLMLNNLDKIEENL